MRICWDNLEKIYFSKNKTFTNGKHLYIEEDSCDECGDPYLRRSDVSTKFCSNPCAAKGRIIPEYVRKKISDTLKGRYVGEKNPFYGKTHSKEYVDSILGKGNPFYGRKHSEEFKECLSIKFSGENNPAWKGGISCEPYCFEWSSKEFKDYIKERDGYKCLNPDCFGNIYRLNVHHVDYNKKNCEPENLITLCTSCNSRANFNRAWHKDWYKAIINRRYGNGYSYDQFSL